MLDPVSEICLSALRSLPFPGPAGHHKAPHFPGPLALIFSREGREQQGYVPPPSVGGWHYLWQSHLSSVPQLPLN